MPPTCSLPFPSSLSPHNPGASSQKLCTLIFASGTASRKRASWQRGVWGNPNWKARVRNLAESRGRFRKDPPRSTKPEEALIQMLGVCQEEYLCSHIVRGLKALLRSAPAICLHPARPFLVGGQHARKPSCAKVEIPVYIAGMCCVCAQAWALT